jgi:hypothetical protein
MPDCVWTTKISDGYLMGTQLFVHFTYWFEIQAAIMKNLSAVLISPKKRPIVPGMGLLGE